MRLMSQARKPSSEYPDQCCDSYGQEALPALSPISPFLLCTALLINSPGSEVHRYSIAWDTSCCIGALRAICLSVCLSILSPSLAHSLQRMHSKFLCKM